MEEIFAQVVANFFFQIHRIRAGAWICIFERLRNFLPRRTDELLMLLHIDEAARDNVRQILQFAGLCGHNRDDNHDAVARKLLAVAQDDVVRVANAETIHEHVFRRHFFVCQLAISVFVELHDLPVVRDEDVVVIESLLLRHFRMFAEEGIVAFDGNEILGLHHSMHVHKILLFCMSAGMYVHHFVMDHLRAFAIERVFYALDGAFVPRNDGR